MNDIAPVETLINMMAADVLTGVIAAAAEGRRGGRAVSSGMAWRGLMKKIATLAAVYVSAVIAGEFEVPALFVGVTWFYAGAEGLSILENLARAGVPVPSALRKAIDGISNDGEPHGEGRGK